MAPASILLTPAIFFACLYGITLIIYIYEIHIRKHKLHGFVYIATAIYFMLKIVGYSIRAAEATLYSTPALYTDVPILVPGQLFLFIGSVVIVKGLQIHLAIPVSMLNKLGHPQHIKRRMIVNKIINIVIPAWMVLGISGIGFQYTNTPGITPSETDILNGLRRTSSWLGVAVVWILTSSILLLSSKLRRLARTSLDWNYEDAFQLFITGRLLLFCAIMLLIGTVYSAVSSLLNPQDGSVFLTDAVFYPMKATTEWLSAVALIRAQPEFHRHIEKHIYSQFKHGLSYYPPNIHARLIKSGQIDAETLKQRLATTKRCDQVHGRGRLTRAESWYFGSEEEAHNEECQLGASNASAELTDHNTAAGTEIPLQKDKVEGEDEDDSNRNKLDGIVVEMQHGFGNNTSDNAVEKSACVAANHTHVME